MTQKIMIKERYYQEYRIDPEILFLPNLYITRNGDSDANLE